MSWTLVFCVYHLKTFVVHILYMVSVRGDASFLTMALLNVTICGWGEIIDKDVYS